MNFDPDTQKERPDSSGKDKEEFLPEKNDIGSVPETKDPAPSADSLDEETAGYHETIFLSEEYVVKEAPEDFGDYTLTEEESNFFRKTVEKTEEQSRYTIREKIVSGGMGTIFRVFDNNLQRCLAMKVILPSLKKDREILSSFVKEAKITGLLEHPNIISVHEIGLDSQTGLYFTMKLAKGESLIDIISRLKKGDQDTAGKYNLFRLLNIFRKVCDAVSFAHFKNIIHRDIKPQNIMVGEHGEVFLMDWGLALFLGEIKEETHPVENKDDEVVLMDISDSAKGEKGLIKGSPTYMAPEQVKGDAGLLDHKCDIFLLGATLYHMFTHEAPYFGKDIYEILCKAENADYLPPEIRNPDRQIPEELCRIIKKAMAKNREDRYDSVHELAKDIDGLIQGKWARQKKHYFAKGDTLMEEGEVGKEAYLILSGEVEVSQKTPDGKKVVLGKLKEGDIVGEMSLLKKDDPRSATVVALQNTRVAVLNQELLTENLKRLPPYMEKIVSTMTERLKNANARIHPNSEIDCTYLVLKQIRLVFKDKTNKRAKKIVMIPQEKLETDISDDLGIPREQVQDVIEKGMALELIAKKDNNLYIPDMFELTQFINLARSVRKDQTAR